MGRNFTVLNRGLYFPTSLSSCWGKSVCQAEVKSGEKRQRLFSGRERGWGPGPEVTWRRSESENESDPISHILLYMQHLILIVEGKGFM